MRIWEGGWFWEIDRENERILISIFGLIFFVFIGDQNHTNKIEK
jgi:hypothetical protein